MIFGEKMPDKDDPKYKERYEREVAAGRKAARLLRLDKAAGGVQRFACKHPKWFLAIVFGIVLTLLAVFAFFAFGGVVNNIWQAAEEIVMKELIYS